MSSLAVPRKSRDVRKTDPRNRSSSLLVQPEDSFQSVPAVMPKIEQSTESVFSDKYNESRENISGRLSPENVIIGGSLEADKTPDDDIFRIVSRSANSIGRPVSREEVHNNFKSRDVFVSPSKPKPLGNGDLSFSDLGIPQLNRKNNYNSNFINPNVNSNMNGSLNISKDISKNNFPTNNNNELSNSKPIQQYTGAMGPNANYNNNQLKVFNDSEKDNNAGANINSHVEDKTHANIVIVAPEVQKGYEGGELRPISALGISKNDHVNFSNNTANNNGLNNNTNNQNGEEGVTKRRRARSYSAASHTSDKVQTIGYALASAKRNKEFHRLFRSIPADDYLVEDYGCALSREILLQGRLYISQRHCCFNSNIFGWVTNLVIAFDEVVSIEKKTTAGLFPNAIVIQTLHARNVFASFIARDSTYELLINIWKGDAKIAGQLSDSDDNSSLYDIETSSEDSDSAATDNDDDGTSDDDDDDDDLNMDGSNNKILSVDGNLKDKSVSESNDIRNNNLSSAAPATLVGRSPLVVASLEGVDIGPEKHEPTECDISVDPVISSQLGDEIINAPLGVAANLLFGSKANFSRAFITENQKCFDLSEFTEWADKNGKKTRTYNYIKPLSFAMGPKQTKCIATETIEKWDLEKCVVVIVSTQTPDVPSGNSFIVKTKYQYTWSEQNKTELALSCGIEWTGKSWIKGAIEKGTIDGQKQFTNDLFTFYKQNLITKSVASVSKTNKKKKKSKGKTPIKEKENKIERKQEMEASQSSILSSIQNTMESYFGTTGTLVIAILLSLFCFLLCIKILFALFGSKSVRTDEFNAKWNSLWVKEENEFWKWLDNSVASDEAGGDFNLLFSENKDYFVADTKWLKKKEILLLIKNAEARINLLKERLNSI